MSTWDTVDCVGPVAEADLDRVIAVAHPNIALVKYWNVVRERSSCLRHDRRRSECQSAVRRNRRLARSCGARCTRCARADGRRPPRTRREFEKRVAT